jgi:hypothetical protein
MNPQPAWAPRRTLTAIGNETVKGLRHGWSERLQIVIEMPLFVIFVLLLGFTVGQGTTIVTAGELDWTLDPRQAAWLFIGMATFTYTYLHVQKMFWRLLAESSQAPSNRPTSACCRPGSTSSAAGLSRPSRKRPSWSSPCSAPPTCSYASICTGTSSPSCR